MNTRFAKYIDRAAKYYRKDNRYYHTIYHVLNMFEYFDAFEKEWDKEFTHLETDWLYNDNRKEELFWSIAFHDAYYMPGFVKNEAFSADIADVELFNEFFNGNLDIQGIKNNIISTIPTNTNFDRIIYFENGQHKLVHDPMKMILHDLDWSGFSSIETLRKNETKIITEAVEVGGIKYDDAVNNQIKFYEAIKNKDLYVTSAFNQFNKVAKKNIKTRLDELSVKGI